MKTLSYNIDIHASPEKVYNTMLGLSDKKTYEKWTAEFNPSSTWEGGWDKGNKILFLGTTEAGTREGMVARIAENIPNKFVSIQHYGVLENDVEITEGPKIEGWKNALENYSFELIPDGTRVTINVDTKEEYADYFDNTWPKALQKLKKLCEV
jgi:hypothetical protein